MAHPFFVTGAIFLGDFVCLLVFVFVFLACLSIIPHVQSTSKAWLLKFHIICTVHLPSTNLVQATFVSHLDPYNNLLKINPAVSLKCILYIANSSPCISWIIFHLLLWSYTQKSPNGFLSNLGKTRCYNVLHSLPKTASPHNPSDLMT